MSEQVRALISVGCMSEQVRSVIVVRPRPITLKLINSVRAG